MKGIFCFTESCSNEEFKEILKKRSYRFLAMAVIGALTIAAVLLARTVGNVQVDDYMEGFFCGAGSGLIAGGILMFLRQRRILKSEELIKEERLKCTDERERAISSQAMKCSCLVTLAGIYGMCIYGALFQPALVRPAALLIVIFLFSYLVANKFFQGRM